MEFFLLRTLILPIQVRSIRRARVQSKFRGELSVPLHPSPEAKIPVLPSFFAVDSVGSERIRVITACYNMSSSSEPRMLHTLGDTVTLEYSVGGENNLTFRMFSKVLAKIVSTLDTSNLFPREYLDLLLKPRGITKIYAEMGFSGRLKVVTTQRTSFYHYFTSFDGWIELASERPADFLLSTALWHSPGCRNEVVNDMSQSFFRKDLMVEAILYLFKQEEAQLEVINRLLSIMSDTSTQSIPAADNTVRIVKKYSEFKIENALRKNKASVLLKIVWL